jgi:hypothetical protein
MAEQNNIILWPHNSKRDHIINNHHLKLSIMATFFKVCKWIGTAKDDNSGLIWQERFRDIV